MAASDYATQILQESLQAICRRNGFNGAEEGALRLLMETVTWYIDSVGQHSQRLAELAGRSVANLHDLREAIVRVNAMFGHAPPVNEALHSLANPAGTEGGPLAVQALATEVAATQGAPRPQLLVEGSVPPFPTPSESGPIRDEFLSEEEIRAGLAERGPHIPKYLPPFPPKYRRVPPPSADIPPALPKHRPDPSTSDAHREAMVAALQELTEPAESSKKSRKRRAAEHSSKPDRDVEPIWSTAEAFGLTASSISKPEPGLRDPETTPTPSQPFTNGRAVAVPAIAAATVATDAAAYEPSHIVPVVEVKNEPVDPALVVEVKDALPHPARLVEATKAVAHLASMAEAKDEPVQLAPVSEVRGESAHIAPVADINVEPAHIAPVTETDFGPAQPALVAAGSGGMPAHLAPVVNGRDKTAQPSAYSTGPPTPDGPQTVVRPSPPRVPEQPRPSPSPSPKRHGPSQGPKISIDMRALPSRAKAVDVNHAFFGPSAGTRRASSSWALGVDDDPATVSPGAGHRCWPSCRTNSVDDDPAFVDPGAGQGHASSSRANAVDEDPALVGLGADQQSASLSRVPVVVHESGSVGPSAATRRASSSLAHAVDDDLASVGLGASRRLAQPGMPVEQQAIAACEPQGRPYPPESALSHARSLAASSVPPAAEGRTRTGRAFRAAATPAKRKSVTQVPQVSAHPPAAPSVPPRRRLKLG